MRDIYLYSNHPDRKKGTKVVKGHNRSRRRKGPKQPTVDKDPKSYSMKRTNYKA